MYETNDMKTDANVDWYDNKTIIKRCRSWCATDAQMDPINKNVNDRRGTNRSDDTT